MKVIFFFECSWWCGPEILDPFGQFFWWGGCGWNWIHSLQMLPEYPCAWGLIYTPQCLEFLCLLRCILCSLYNLLQLLEARMGLLTFFEIISPNQSSWKMDDTSLPRFHSSLDDSQAFFESVSLSNQHFLYSSRRVESHQVELASPISFLLFIFGFALHKVSRYEKIFTFPVMNSYAITPKAKKSTGYEWFILQMT